MKDSENKRYFRTRDSIRFLLIHFITFLLLFYYRNNSLKGIIEGYISDVTTIPVWITSLVMHTADILFAIYRNKKKN